MTETGCTDPQNIKRRFVELYDKNPRLFRAPGRVNLIGEHTDYNDGFVLPMAIDRETVVAAAPRNDRHLRVRSSTVNDQFEIDLNEPRAARQSPWIPYIEGMARTLIANGKRLTGADLLIESNLPIGSGLSSSAALEISTGFALLNISDEEEDPLALALAGREAEHRYVGTLCGIMDQYVVTFGRACNALLIDCRSLESTQIPLDLKDTVLVICDTHVKHSLASSEYNLRRAQCIEGVKTLQQVLPEIKALRDVNERQFREFMRLLPETVRRRCRHVITENERTLLTVDAIRAGDLEAVGRFMNESHRSLKDDYEVSCTELDLMVEIAQSMDEVLGARMTGGGFGGCTVNLVSRDAVEEFRTRTLSQYFNKTGLSGSSYVVTAANGVNELRI
jgi:galactokinase